MLAACVLGVIGTHSGCGDDDVVAEALAALGSGCLVNSDCDEGLTCAFRLCHQPCETSKDCDDVRCLVGNRPANVCQLPELTACTLNSECPEGQLCGVDDQCRDACSADKDCVRGQVCRQGTCADVDELESDELPSGDGPVALDKPCNYSSECKAGPDGLRLACKFGACTYECFLEEDCPRFYDCTSPDDSSEPGTCEEIEGDKPFHCDPDDPPVACDCFGGVTGIQTCLPDGSGLGPCTGSSPECDPL